MAIKEKIKENYAKNPRAVTSLGLLLGAATAAVVGTLTGVVEPDVAMSAITKLFSALMMGS